MKAIVTSDWHARSDRPRCRIDGGKLVGEGKANSAWQLFQRQCFKKIAIIANNKKVPMAVIGDIFNKGHVIERIIIDVLSAFRAVKEGTVFVAGNHDLPGHIFENLKDSAIGILMKASRIKNFSIDCLGSYSHFGSEIVESDIEPSVLFLHTLVFETEKEVPPNCEAITADDLLKEFPDKKWIITGDMHRAFHYQKKGRHVINCGCINRQKADELEYKPSVFYIDTENEIVERILLDDDGIFVEDAYLTIEKERNDKLIAFAEAIKLKKDSKINLSLLDNLEVAIQKNKKILGQAVIDEIYSLIEGEA